MNGNSLHVKSVNKIKSCLRERNFCCEESIEKSFFPFLFITRETDVDIKETDVITLQ